MGNFEIIRLIFTNTQLKANILEKLVCSIYFVSDSWAFFLIFFTLLSFFLILFHSLYFDSIRFAPHSLRLSWFEVGAGCSSCTNDQNILRILLLFLCCSLLSASNAELVITVHSESIYQNIVVGVVVSSDALYFWLQQTDTDDTDDKQ